MTPTRVVLAEDQPMVRAGFRALLDSRADIEVAKLATILTPPTPTVTRTIQGPSEG